jgi:hypothetical protein
MIQAMRPPGNQGHPSAMLRRLKAESLAFLADVDAGDRHVFAFGDQLKAILAEVLAR